MTGMSHQHPAQTDTFIKYNKNELPYEKIKSKDILITRKTSDKSQLKDILGNI
jgi:hypothetical protein